MEAGGTANQGIGEGQGRTRPDLVQDHFLPEEAHLDVVERRLYKRRGAGRSFLAVAHLAAVLSVAVNFGRKQPSVEEVLWWRKIFAAEAEEAAYQR